MIFSRANTDAFNSKRCAYCGEAALLVGLLRRCSNCKGAWWSNTVVNRLLRHKRHRRGQSNNCNQQAAFLALIEGAEIPEPSDHYVYVLEIDKRSEYDYYVGQTSFHPVKRLLNHVRGHNAASSVRGHVVGIYTWEGPMSLQASKNREAQLRREMEVSGDWGRIAGGH